MNYDFFRDVLPESGYYCLTLLPKGEHVWAESLDELADIAEQRIDFSGLYFGTASFSSIANRKQTNVLALKSLRLDIDAGPEKLSKHGEKAVYATQKQALAASVQFFRDTKLAPTYVVSSGAGLHIYYCLTESVPPDAWLPLAGALQALGAKHQLRVDPSVTQDTARILRVPGALHPNGQRVKVLQRLGIFHNPAELREKLGVLAPVRKATGINDDLDLSYQGPPSSAVKIAGHCGALREVASTGGNVAEPHWRAMIGLVKRTVEGLDIAHQWSSGYDGYDEAEVDRKFHAWATGPTTCAEFAKYSDSCSTCKHRGTIKSPINLGLMTAPEIVQLPEVSQAVLQPPQAAVDTGAPWDGHLPEGFTIEDLGGGSRVLIQTVIGEKESPTGEMVPCKIKIPFTHNIFWFSQWAEADDSDDNAQVVINLWAGTYAKVYIMDQTAVSSQFKLMEYMSGKAIHTTSHKKAGQAMLDYAKAQLQHIHATHKNLKVTDHMGLRTLESGELVACQGKYTIFPDGVIRDTMLSSPLRTLAASFTIPLPPGGEKWEADVWDEHIIPRAKQHVKFLKDFYDHEGMERFQLAIMMGLASPFMAFVTGEYSGGPELPNNSSLTVSLFSRDTARGKTTAAQAAILAYGRPALLSGDTGKAGATVNARLGTLSLHGTLPSIMDEMSDLSPGEVATTVSTVANGSGKKVMNRSRRVRQESTWALINLITTNVSQQDMVTVARSAAEPVLYRMLEINVDDMPEYSLEARAAFREEWATVNRECVGALGALIHREICRLGMATMTKLVGRCVTKAEEYVNATQSARFQSRGLGAMLALDIVLRRCGIELFSIQALSKVFKQAHDSNVEYAAENTMPKNPLQILSTILTDLAPNTVVTQDERDGGHDRLDRPLNLRMPDVIHARHILVSRISYVSVEAVRKWCLERGQSVRPIIDAAKEAGILICKEQSRGDGKVMRSYGLKVLTKGLPGDMRISCMAYTFNTLELNKLLGGEGFVPQIVQDGPPLPNTGTEG